MKKIISYILNPGTRTMKWSVTIFFILIVILEFTDKLKQVTDFLNSESLSFYILNLKFSVYKLIKLFILIISLLWITKVFSDFMIKTIKETQTIKTSNKELIIKIFQISVYFIVFFISIEIIGIDFTAFKIFSGSIGIGIGFGLQKITSNFISGLILLFERSIKIGDIVELKDGTYGIVKHTRARYSLIEASQGQEVLVPNEEFITNAVINWTHTNTKARIDITVEVYYESDIKKVQELMLESAIEHPMCINLPEPKCYLRNFEKNAVEFLLLFWVNDITQGCFSPKSEVMFSILKKFKEFNIQMPLPQYNIIYPKT